MLVTHPEALLTRFSSCLSVNINRLRFSNLFHRRSFSRFPMAGRTYNDAVECLNTLQSNAATLEASRASGGKLVKVAIPETIEYLKRIGYSVRL